MVSFGNFNFPAENLTKENHGICCQKDCQRQTLAVIAVPSVLMDFAVCIEHLQLMAEQVVEAAKEAGWNL